MIRNAAIPNMLLTHDYHRSSAPASRLRLTFQLHAAPKNRRKGEKTKKGKAPRGMFRDAHSVLMEMDRCLQGEGEVLVALLEDIMSLLVTRSLSIHLVCRLTFPSAHRGITWNSFLKKLIICLQLKKKNTLFSCWVYFKMSFFKIFLQLLLIIARMVCFELLTVQKSIGNQFKIICFYCLNEIEMGMEANA